MRAGAVVPGNLCNAERAGRCASAVRPPKHDDASGRGPGSAGLAVLLSCTVVLTAATIGLYRPEICIERRRLLINTCVAGLLAFPAVLAISRSFNVGLSPYAILWLTKLMFAWLACMVTSRVIFNRVMRERWFVRRILVLGSGPHLAQVKRLTNSGRGRLFEPIFANHGMGRQFLDEPPTPATLRRQRIGGS